MPYGKAPVPNGLCTQIVQIGVSKDMVKVLQGTLLVPLTTLNPVVMLGPGYLGSMAEQCIATTLLKT